MVSKAESNPEAVVREIRRNTRRVCKIFCVSGFCHFGILSSKIIDI